MCGTSGPLFCVTPTFSWRDEDQPEGWCYIFCPAGSTPYFLFPLFLIGFLYFFSRRNLALLPRFTFLFFAFFS